MSGQDITRQAVAAAERGARAWRAAVRHQRQAAGDHGDFYDLAAALVETVRALESLVALVGRQTAGYGWGRILRDDTGADPAARLAEAATRLRTTGELLAQVEHAANAYWSAISHIAVEDPS